MTSYRPDIRLLGFAGFEASQRFLRSLEDEIWVERWDRRPQLDVVRPTDLQSAQGLRLQLESPCLVAVVSAHGGCDMERMFFSSATDERLYVDTIGCLGATSAVLIDACFVRKFFAQLSGHSERRVVMVGVDTQDEITYGRDSVTVIGDVIRELCYTDEAPLDPRAVHRAVKRVNAKITARNKHVPGSGTGRPLAVVCQGGALVD